jgi:hypothetical protein
MARLMSWFARLLGLQSVVEDVIESNLRLHTAVAGAVAQADALKEAEQVAAEFDKTHPQLAAALRAKVAEIVGHPVTSALPAGQGTAPALPEVPPKANGKPKKSPALTTPTPTPGGE